MNNKEYQHIIEAILFAAGEPVSLKVIAEALEITESDAQSFLHGLADEYDFELRGIKLIQIGDAYQLTTRKEHFDYIKKVLKDYTITSLSQAALETLAIVAYRQPVTRPDIEQIRGVKSTSSLDLLIDRGLVRFAGKLDLPGKPSSFETTDEFLKLVELNSIKQLPDYDEFFHKQLEIETKVQEEEEE